MWDSAYRGLRALVFRLQKHALKNPPGIQPCNFCIFLGAKKNKNRGVSCKYVQVFTAREFNNIKVAYEKRCDKREGRAKPHGKARHTYVIVSEIRAFVRCQFPAERHVIKYFFAKSHQNSCKSRALCTISDYVNMKAF